MFASPQPYYDKVLARVKDPRQRLALVRLMEDSDRDLANRIAKEARARDEARAKAAKPANKRKRGKG